MVDKLDLVNDILEKAASAYMGATKDCLVPGISNEDALLMVPAHAKKKARQSGEKNNGRTISRLDREYVRPSARAAG